MRKFGLAVAAFGLAVALLWGSASAANAATLTVFGEERGDGNESRNSFVFHEKLLSGDGEHVGRVRIEVTRTDRRSFDVKALFRFHGGKIRVAGPLPRGRGADVVPITGGKGRFHGISGRLKVTDTDSGLTKYRFRFQR